MLEKRTPEDILNSIYGIPDPLKSSALQWIKKGEPETILALFGSHELLSFVNDNVDVLLELDIYELALFQALTCINAVYIHPNPSSEDHFEFISVVGILLDYADYNKIRACADPPPDKVKNNRRIAIYRGVGNSRNKERPFSYSWTLSPNIAAWFAETAAKKMPKEDRHPAVYYTQVSPKSILFYRKNEHEVFLLGPECLRPRRIAFPKPLDPKELSSVNKGVI